MSSNDYHNIMEEKAIAVVPWTITEYNTSRDVSVGRGYVYNTLFKF